MSDLRLKDVWPSAAAIVLTVVTLTLFWADLQQQSRNRLQIESAKFERLLDSSFDRGIESLRSLQQFFRSSSFVGRNEFKSFVNPILSRTPELASMKWVPQVDESQRLKYINDARADGISDFNMKQWSPTLGWTVSREPWARHYYPVFYIEPAEQMLDMLGCDLGSNKEQSKAIARALQASGPVASRAINLAEGSKGILVISSLAFEATVNNRQQQGLLMAEFKLDDIFGRTLALFDDDVLNINVYEEGDLNRLIYASPDQAQAEFSIELQHRFLDQNWLIKVSPSTRFNVGHNAELPWYFLLLGLLLISAIILYNRNTIKFTRNVRQRMSSASVDLTEKNEMLQRSEIRQRAIVSMMKDAVVTIDNNGVIEEFSTAAEVIFGYTADEVIGNNVKLLMPAPIANAHDSYLENYLKSHIPHIIGVNRDVIGQRKDGTTFPLNLTISEQIFDKRSIFIGVLRDQSVEKKLESDQQIAIENLDRANEQLERANYDLEQFGYVASHDLKAPLRAIHNLAGWISEDLGDNLHGESLENMVLLQKRVTRLDSLLTDLLEYSRAGRLEGKAQAINSYQIISDIVDLYGIPEHVSVNIQETLPIIFSNRAGFELLIRNLVGNAIKHNTDDSARVDISCETFEDRFVFYVSDNGAGIAPENHQKIFEVFTSLRSRDEVEGSGMGLSICRRAAQFIGGEIWIDAGYQAGVRFGFSVPRDFLAQNDQT
ncbi:MAG: two-component system sensor kinase FixL [Planctomycetota bacterium]|jgi:two-component system sensor kinase FixL